MKSKVILISQFPLPDARISSWPKLFEYYFRHNKDVRIDGIICPSVKMEMRFSGLEYYIIKVFF
jgi:hypothetical protein